MTCSTRIAALTFALSLVVGPALAHDGTPEVILPVAKGVYRLPFESGTMVNVSSDHVSHNPHNRIDMSPIDNSKFHNIVAAGGGWIEYIVDGFDTTCPRTRFNSNPCDPSIYDGPSGSCCVFGTSDCKWCEEGPPTCDTKCRNNYVWIRHPNGEWTKYTHFRVGTVTAQGLVVGQWVEAGTVLGVEGDVGFATGRTNGVHLHFEVAVPDVVDTSLEPGDPGYDPLGVTYDVGGLPDAVGDIARNANRQNRIPVFCQLPFPVDDAAAPYTATACNGQCDTTQQSSTVPDDVVFYRQVTDDATFAGFSVESGGGAAVKAGDRITLGPGFHAAAGSFFAASIGACDEPGF